MFTALVGNRKGMQPQKLCTSYPSISRNVLSLHSSSFTAVPYPVWEGHGGMVLNRMYGEGESWGKPANPRSAGRMMFVLFLYFIYLLPPLKRLCFCLSFFFIGWFVCQQDYSVCCWWICTKCLEGVGPGTRNSWILVHEIFYFVTV